MGVVVLARRCSILLLLAVGVALVVAVAGLRGFAFGMVLVVLSSRMVLLLPGWWVALVQVGRVNTTAAAAAGPSWRQRQAYLRVVLCDAGSRGGRQGGKGVCLETTQPTNA